MDAYRNEESVHWVVKVRVPDEEVANQFGIPANTAATVINQYGKYSFPFLEDQIKTHPFCRRQRSSC